MATLSLQEVAERLDVHYMTAYRYVRTGRLAATQVAGEWRVERADLERFRKRAAPRRGRTGRGAVDRRAVAERFQRCLLRGDEHAAWQVVEDAMASGASPADVLNSVVVPALHEVGEAWASKRCTVAQEHAATAVATRVVGRLGPRFARRGRSQGAVVVGVVAGDAHAVGVHALADLLRGAGFTVTDLGADVPVESFVEAANAADRLVGVGIASYVSGRDRQVRQVVRALRGITGVPLVLGGAAIGGEADARHLGADAWGATIADACEFFVRGGATG